MVFKYNYWQFNYHVIQIISSPAWGGSCLEIMTPWFYLALAIGYPEPLCDIYSNQIAFSYKRNKNPKEGDCYFLNNWFHRWNWVTAIEQCYTIKYPLENGI